MRCNLENAVRVAPSPLSSLSLHIAATTGQTKTQQTRDSWWWCSVFGHLWAYFDPITLLSILSSIHKLATLLIEL